MEQANYGAFHLYSGDAEIYVLINQVFRPQSTPMFGGLDTESTVRIKSGGFSCEGSLYISTGQLNEFLRQLELCYENLNGNAEVINEFENNFRLHLKFDGIGHVTVSGFYEDNSEFSNKLEFEFATDQTCILPMINGLRGISSKYHGFR